MKRMPGCIFYSVIVSMVVFIAISIAILTMTDTPYRKVAVRFRNIVVLHGPSSNNGEVALFRNPPGGKYIILPDGTRCTKSSPDIYRFDAGGSSLYFWRLKCVDDIDEHFGFVNADYVH